MEQVKFMNLVMDKTNKKLNELQAQVIVLEAQLACALEINRELTNQIENIKVNS